jgi:DNA helicase-2/ATP-dependent DNA helicase PcrA
VDNILRFEKDFPGAKVIRLERNYRSTPQILGAASGLIAANQGRLGKTLWTEAGSGERIRISGHWDSEAEARIIGDEIEGLQRQSEHLADMAILVRASYQMREFEDRFVTLGIPYRVIGGPRFYERQEVRDALAYLRLVNSPTDDLAFERIINRPKRGIGDATIQTLHRAARAEGIPLLEAARRIVDTDELGPRIRTALKALITSFDRWAALARTASQTELAETVLDESGYTAMWQNDKSPDAPGRLDNLKELVRSMEPFENLAGFLEHVSLVMEAVEGDTEDKISLMTLHAAKGLEFDTVFLPGWEEGLFPSQRTMDESGIAGLEEERRLAYVGITRARHRLHLSRAAVRSAWGAPQYNPASRFLDEIPEQLVEWQRAEAATTSRRPSTPAVARLAARPGVRSPGNRPLIALAAGDRVTHDTYGLGTVVRTEGEGDRTQAHVDFGGETGVKRFLLRYAPLEKI